MATPLSVRSSLDSSRHLSMFPPPSPQYSSQHTPSFSLPSIPSPSSLARPPSPERLTHSTSRPFESDNFLTLIAAQERKVLELKEEMHKAETDLEKLKKQWAVHEARKKRSELRGSKRLEPLSVPKTTNTIELGIDTLGGNSYENKGPNGDYRDPEKHRTRRSESMKKPPRRVFQGSRHAKTLSLLSPTALTNQELHALRSPTSDHPVSDVDSSQNKISRADTTPTPLNTKVKSSGIPLSTSAGSPTRPKDAILYPAKQLVGDFREGLWTFFEDLRQAAVGDDISGGDPRHIKRGSVSREGKHHEDDQHVKCNNDVVVEELGKVEETLMENPPQKKEERRTRARRTSSKNDGYAFRLDRGLLRGGAGEAIPQPPDPNTPPSLKTPAAQKIPLPTRPIIPALSNPSKNSSTHPTSSSDPSSAIPHDPDPDGWNTWDSSPVAPQRSTPRPVGSVITTNSPPPNITTSTTTTTLPSSPSLAASPYSSTTPTTDAGTSSTHTTTTTTANSSVRTSLTSLGGGGGGAEEEGDSDTITPKPT